MDKNIVFTASVYRDIFRNECDKATMLVSFFYVFKVVEFKNDRIS